MTKKQKAKIIIERLNQHYPTEIICYLNYTQDYELLFATILSAQCTDDRVNIVTKDLFKKYTTLQDYTQVPINELEQDIRSTGFYKNKAKSLQMAATMLLDVYNGILPSDIEELTKLPGVGRKTANVVRCHVFGLPSVVVDTHVKRITYKLGLTISTDPVKIEFELMKILPKKSWIAYNHQIIAHGRKICKAPTPRCDTCFFTDICAYYINSTKSKLK
ncbi:MAG: endonuclease III [Defluviitaleaceae bacterium]|nr:endonuclease III [Defluviitaleaceae bacterium]